MELLAPTPRCNKIYVKQPPLSISTMSTQASTSTRPLWEQSSVWTLHHFSFALLDACCSSHAKLQLQVTATGAADNDSQTARHKFLESDEKRLRE